MPEGLFRYVAPSRVHVYAALGWHTIGETLSPHDGLPVVMMEWPHADLLPVEPEEAPMLAQIVAPGARGFCAGAVFDQGVVVRAAPIIRYMAEQAWTRPQVLAYCRKRGWAITTLP